MLDVLVPLGEYVAQQLADLISSCTETGRPHSYLLAEARGLEPPTLDSQGEDAYGLHVSGRIFLALRVLSFWDYAIIFHKIALCRHAHSLVPHQFTSIANNPHQASGLNGLRSAGRKSPFNLS